MRPGAAIAARERLAMTRSLAWCLAAVVLATGWSRMSTEASPGGDPTPPASSIPPAGLVVEDLAQGEFRLVVRVFGRGGPQELVVSRLGKTILKLTPAWHTTRFPEDEDGAHRPFRDVTRDGRVELLVHSGSGRKAAPGLTAYSLDDRPRRLFRVEGDDWPQLVDVDGDDSFEVRVTEHDFDAFGTCWADQPRPRVVLRYDGGSLRPSLDLMRRDLGSWRDPEPNAADVARGRVVLAYRTQIPRSFEGRGQLTPVVSSYVLKLIYTGRADEAFRFLDRCGWNGGPYRQALMAQLKRSRWWESLKVLNRGKWPPGLPL